MVRKYIITMLYHLLFVQYYREWSKSWSDDFNHKSNLLNFKEPIHYLYIFVSYFPSPLVSNLDPTILLRCLNTNSFLLIEKEKGDRKNVKELIELLKSKLVRVEGTITFCVTRSDPLFQQNRAFNISFTIRKTRECR